MQRDSAEHLELLPEAVPSESDAELDTTNTNLVQVRVSGVRPYLRIICVLLIITCTCANFALWCFSPSTTAPAKYSTLEQPSTYIGLDKIQYNATEEREHSFRSYPLLAAHISRANRRRIWGDSSKLRLTTVGTVSADARRFFVTAEVSTVVQFRTTDFGYETCALHFTLPASSVDFEKNLTVWRLDMTTRLDPASLSWNTRPPRSGRLGVIALVPNTTVVIGSPWHCAWGAFQTFEFTFVEDDDTAVLDFWQDPRNVEAGPILTQRSSVV